MGGLACPAKAGVMAKRGRVAQAVQAQAAPQMNDFKKVKHAEALCCARSCLLIAAAQQPCSEVKTSPLTQPVPLTGIIPGSTLQLHML